MLKLIGKTLMKIRQEREQNGNVRWASGALHRFQVSFKQVSATIQKMPKLKGRLSDYLSILTARRGPSSPCTLASWSQAHLISAENVCSQCNLRKPQAHRKCRLTQRTIRNTVQKLQNDLRLRICVRLGTTKEI